MHRWLHLLLNLSFLDRKIWTINLSLVGELCRLNEIKLQEHFVN